MKADRFYPHLYVKHVNSTRRVARFGEMLFEWNGTHWLLVDSADAQAEAYRWLSNQDERWATPTNAWKASESVRLAADDLPAMTSQVIVPTKSGYVHWNGQGFELKAHDPSLGFRHCISCAYGPAEAAAPRFYSFLETVLPDEGVRLRVQEYVGYTLIGDTRFQRAQMWLGEGANGKGTLARVVQALHGQPETVNLADLTAFRLSHLMNASLIYIDELPRRRINEELVKSMIAGEKVFIDIKNKTPISASIHAKWLVLGNDVPDIRDHSAGFWRRWDLIPFSVTLPEQDRDSGLAEALERDELGGVLHWALAGLQRLLERGRFDPNVPAAVTRLTQAAKSATNPVEAWAEDVEARLKSSCDMPKGTVYAEFRNWCSNNGMEQVDVGIFWKHLQRKLGAVAFERRRIGEGPSGKKKQIHTCNVELSMIR